MIVNCSKCKEKMRVDESRIPSGDRVKIRCPTCGEIQPYSAQVDHSSTAPKPLDKADPSSLQKMSGRDRTGGSSVRKSPEELTIPADAFQDFRFPAERGATGTSRKETQTNKSSKRLGKIFFLLISVAVIAVFALIVNIVLPGPAGRGPGMGMPEWEERSDQRPR
jgi:predicted Zn finger-like uncharacterized protein